MLDRVGQDTFEMYVIRGCIFWIFQKIQIRYWKGLYLLYPLILYLRYSQTLMLEDEAVGFGGGGAAVLCHVHVRNSINERVSCP